MVKYYYDRYNTTVVYPATAAGAITEDYHTSMAINQTMSSSYSYSATNGYQMTGTRLNITAAQAPIAGYYHTYFYQNNTYLIRFGSSGNLAPSGGYYENMVGNKRTQITGTWARGTLQTSNIQAEYGTYPVNGRHTDGYWYVQKGPVNTTPTLNISTPSNNVTLYENDVFTITGTASDVDAGNTVTIRYQINAEPARAIKAFVSTGSVAEAFSKTLKFVRGNLYDEETLIASNLTDGVAHALKFWTTDDQGGTSTTIERTFYVIPNRAPSLTVNTPVISGNIDNDEFEITGSYNDLDKNTTTVAYRINGSNSVQVAKGTGGDFNFKVKFNQLQVGLNSIVIEVIDSYGAKTSRTVKLNKNEVKTEQLKSTARFKIHPPLNTATGIVLWVRRDENLDLSASISMTQVAEAENFVQMTKSRTAPMTNTTGVVEDQFEYESAAAADKIILQLDIQRSSLTANEKIYLLVGVID